MFGADSAATVFEPKGERVYTNAEKIVNLHKRLPIGMVTYGLGGIGGRSVTSLAKDLRRFFMAEVEGRESFHLDEGTYTVEGIAQDVRNYFFEELYRDQIVPAVEAYNEKADEDAKVAYPTMGFIVGGISAGSAKSEVWLVEIGPGGTCGEPTLQWGSDVDGVIVYKGTGEALDRLLAGTTMHAWNALQEQGLTDDEIGSLLVDPAPLAQGSMPIQDAIDLVEYLASVVAGYLRFSAGPDVVAPPIDLAAITAHERFKWVKRKHWYPAELNP